MKSNQYDIKKVEEKIKKFWEKEKIYKFDPKKKNTYSIDTPPPYISGRMHIGHAFSYSQQDFIARYRRMKQGVFYPFGTDDNGLPTEKFIERTNNVKSKNMSRAEFIDLCLKTLKKITPECIQDYIDLGISCDYSIYYSTIDKPTQKISQQSFIDLFKADKIYKKEFPTLWCTECQTTIAQAELEDKNENSLFSTLKFKADGKDLLIATTRPELLPACVAVFINPKDKRYTFLKGKTAEVPLFNFEVPILEDESAEIEKGTGVLMICSYGDKFDVEAINRHNLEPKLILNKEGKLNQTNYKGLSIKQARDKILQDLEKEKLITEQKSIDHIVNVHDKCGTPIEFLPTEQWFIKILNEKKKLIEQGKKIKWHPKFMRVRYENWVKGLEWDWSISRDRHFGIPIPVWECKECNEIILPNESELPVDPLQTKKICPKCKKQAEPEEKVLDTWATSSLTPQIASSLVNNKIPLPFSLRPQAHDIIRTWAFYTIVKSLYHKNKIPWEDIVVSGYVTLGGKKMSKSKGTGIQPKEVLEKYGADALRFWAAGSKLGEDLDYQEQDLVAGNKLINKLWNASRFVFMNLEDYKCQKPLLEKTDKLFLESLAIMAKDTTDYFEKYKYSKAKARVENFFWKDFADNYLEIIKYRIYNEKGSKKISAQYTLYKSLLTILKLLAPITPFITEEIYQTHFKKTEKTKSIHVSDWPDIKLNTKPSIKDEALLSMFYNLLSKVRQEKAKAQKSVKSEIILTIPKKDTEDLKDLLEDLKSVTNAKEIKDGKFKVDFL